MVVRAPMSQHLPSFLEAQLSADVVAGLASYLQVPEVKAGTAALAAQQALLVAMTQKATSPQGVRELLAILTSGSGAVAAAASQVAAGSNLAGVGQTGAPVVASLLGGNETPVVNWLSGAIGISQDASRVLLSLLAPHVLHAVSTYLTSNGHGINASTVADVFGTQAAPLLANIPVGLATALSVPAVPDLVRGTRAPTPAEASHATGLEFLKWVLPLIAIVTLMVYVMGRRTPGSDAGKNRVDVPAAPSGLDGGETAPGSLSSAGPSPAAENAVVVSLGDMVDRPLPRQRPIRVPENGLESRLLAFISDPGNAIDSTRSFTFDRLEFDPAAATLRPGSNAQMDAVAAILKAYPRVAIKISGYTDNVGDDVVNLRLSSARAEATKNALVSRGVSARRIDTEGFGAQYPIASNATEQGRQRNRRIDVRVTRK